MQVRVSFLHDVADSAFVFEQPDLSTTEAKDMQKKWSKHYRPSARRVTLPWDRADTCGTSLTGHSIEVAISRLSELTDADFDEVDRILAVLNDLGSPPGDKPLKRAQLWMPLRHALTGRKVRASPIHD
jgi:hypothetical protein